MAAAKHHILGKMTKTGFGMESSVTISLELWNVNEGKFRTGAWDLFTESTSSFSLGYVSAQDNE